MELFDVKGCLSEEGLRALVGGQLDETQRLEAAEHDLSHGARKTSGPESHMGADERAV